MKVSVFMDDNWDFIAMINNSLHFRFSIIAMKKEIIFSVSNKSWTQLIPFGVHNEACHTEQPLNCGRSSWRRKVPK